MRDIKTATHLNLGDNIFYMHLFRKIIDHHNGNIRIFHYLHKKYISEISNFIQGYEDNIILLDILEYIHSIIPIEMNDIPGWFYSYDAFVEDHKEKKHAVTLLYGDDEKWQQSHPNMPFITEGNYYDQVLFRQFMQYCEFMNVECPIMTVEDTLLDMKEFLNPNILTDEYDLIIGNSTPMSGQWTKDKSFFNYIIDRIDLKKVKVVSLEPTGYKDIPSTIESGLSLLQLGNIAINAKNIIAIHSSPYCVLINKYNYQTVKEFSVLHGWGKYKYSFGNTNNYSSPQEFINTYKLPIEWCKI